MLFRTKLAAAGLCFTMLSANGAAAQIATVTTDLNVRSGPGPAYGVVSVIPATQGVFILGCTPTMLWCQVSWDGQTGWAYGAYLAYERDGSRVVVAQTAPRVTIPVIQPDVAVEAQTTVGAIEQPADVDVEADVDPPAPVRNFVFEHELDPYLLEGEVVVGSTLPEVVRLTTVPDYEYRVAYVNQRRVLVDPETREVVYVVR